MKVAVAGGTLYPAPATTVQDDPVPVQAPDHPANVDQGAGVAVSVTESPAKLYVASHVEPQSIPAGSLVTVPEPVPAFVTCTRPSKRNSAVTERFVLIVTVQVRAVPEQSPPQPMKTEANG